MAKHINDCQTQDELAESIAYHLQQGGMRRDIIHLDTGERKTVHDEHETHRVYGIALNKYNEIRESYPKLPLPQIKTSDPLSGLAQIQQLCKTSGEAGDEKQATAETGQKSPPANIVNIDHFQGVLGDVQSENVQIGDYASIHKQPKSGEKKAKLWIISWIFKKTSHLIGAIVVAIIGGLIVAILIDIFGDLGWLQSIKEFVYNILWPNGYAIP